MAELVAGGHGHGDVLAVHGRVAVHEVVTHEGFIPRPEFGGLHEFVASGDPEILRVRLVLPDQRVVFGMDETEVELGAHLDEFEELQFFILGHHGGTERHVVAARGSDLGFEDLLTFQTFAQDLDGHVAVAVELGAHALFHLGPGLSAFGVALDPLEEVLIGDQLQNEFHAAVQVESQTDGAGSLFADQTHDVPVVLKVGALDFLGQVNTPAVGGLEQCLRLEELGILGLDRLGFFDQFQGIGVFLVLEQCDEGIVVVRGDQRIHGRAEDQQHHDDDGGSQYEGTFVHLSDFSSFFSPSAAFGSSGTMTSWIPARLTLTKTRSAISTVRILS